ncbi:SIMPL domain-containing protein [Lignipirellula cremea]|uniref:Oxidative stress defense protein n=1 Tax=Lignipirellula cremea TaxID=2528010 RepID=A0A518DVJ0_9BACT|nr:SIMPL domain-containing protein [Lignipirellula cremea]QDU95843.1 oxidative stress defense protein [Lignipirellula cremea]
MFAVPRSIRPVLFLCAYLILAVTTVPVQPAVAQGGGGYAPAAGGYTSSTDSGLTRWSNSEPLSTTEATSHIAIDGVAERRLMPDQIRLVMAVATEAETLAECRQTNAKLIADVLKSWTDNGTPRDKIVTDFISVTPRYAWRNELRDNEPVRVQQRDGFRMLTNLHIAIASEEAAMDAVERAFACGVTEIVTFEYGSSRINAAKEEARAAALAAAQKKADQLLAVFAERPPVINVQEKTAVFLPQQLYTTYQNILEEDIEYNSRDKPRIKAYRPRMRFYHGLAVEADDRPAQIPLQPEIVITSTVRLYFRSPAAAGSPNPVARPDFPRSLEQAP